MPDIDTTMYIANLDFILNYDDGTSNDEIEYELFKIAFQQKESIHYDRQTGGSFQDLEQERSSEKDVLMLMFSTNMIESVYLNNQKKSFNPYIIVGATDITTELVDTTLYVVMYYRLLKNVKQVGSIALGV